MERECERARERWRVCMCVCVCHRLKTLAMIDHFLPVEKAQGYFTHTG